MNFRTLPLLLSLGLASGAQAAVVFQDSFGSNSSANWTFSGENAGTWAAADNKLQSSTSATAHNPTVPGFAAINGINTSNHFKIEADVQVIGTAPGKPALNFGHVGVFWGYQDANTYSVGYLRTHYNEVTAWESPYAGELLTPLGFDAVNAADVNGVSYHLSYEVDYLAQTMVVRLDGVSATFTGANFAVANSIGGVGGQLGVISWGERVSYDNVVVTDYTIADPVPEPATLALLALGAAGLATRRKRI